MAATMPPLTQQHRPIAVQTPLGADVLLLTGFGGVEGVSMPFRFRLRMLSERGDIVATDLLKKPVSVRVSRGADDEPRIIHGQVSRFTTLGNTTRGLFVYEAEVVPALWFLSLSRDCRIFQNKSTLDIVEQLFGELGVSDYKSKCTGTYQPRTYCVQYRESTLEFVSRLLEEEGIFYYFEHTTDAHTLVLADGPTAVESSPVKPAIAMAPSIGAAYLEDDFVLELVSEHAVQTAKVSVTDYDFEKPKTNLAANTDGAAADRTGESYDFPGDYVAKEDGTALSRRRLEMLEAMQQMVQGRSNSPAFIAGHKIDVKEHFRQAVNQAYHVLQVEHAAEAGDFTTQNVPFRYEARFTAIPASVPYRPPMVTPRPVVHGTQTAVVVGPSGEEIYVDKYGRVKVQFPWDRTGNVDQNSSCWVRVATTWAGKNWGAIQIPRIGQEVIVDFLEGDPDHPIITGSVYNADQMPPYTLPDNQTQSGVKSRSSKGGGTSDFNEIRFEDKKGSEELSVQAQKDMKTLVKNDETRDVQHDRTTTIKNDETLTVTDGNHKVTVSKGNQTIEVTQGNQSVTLGQGNQTVEIKMGNQTIKVDMGNISTKAALGSIAMEAMQQIELKVGANSIKIDQSGVTIQGLMVKVQGNVQTQIQAPITQVNGDGMLTLKGGLTMIN